MFRFLHLQAEELEAEAVAGTGDGDRPRLRERRERPGRGEGTAASQEQPVAGGFRDQTVTTGAVDDQPAYPGVEEGSRDLFQAADTDAVDADEDGFSTARGGHVDHLSRAGFGAPRSGSKR